MFSGAQFTGLKITNVRYAHLIFWHKAAVIFFFFFGRGVGMGGSKSLDLNIATVKRYGDSHLVAKSPFSKKATVYLATVTISTVANYTLPQFCVSHQV